MPAFMFMVGVAMPMSFARRRAQGDSFQRQFGHAIRRAFILVVMGWLLQNQRHLRTDVRKIRRPAREVALLLVALPPQTVF